MNFSLSAPSKTFLLGEYVALNGGPNLVLTTEPRFNLTIKYTQPETPVIFEGIHKESPAGKFILHYADIFKGYQLHFNDPHHGLGGFGASSAQYLLSFLLKQSFLAQSLKLNKHSDKKIVINCSIEKILKNYHEFSRDEVGVAPSGADVIAQTQGGISYFHRSRAKWLSLQWPFSQLNYYLVRTGAKLATHQHLKEVTNLVSHRLESIVFSGLQNLQIKNQAGFIQNIKDYAAELEKQHLVAEQTLQLLQKINAHHEILAAKGCGALGADVILILADKKQHESLCDWLETQTLTIVHSGNDVSTGAHMKIGVNLIP